jgi:hypothetical protein
MLKRFRTLLALCVAPAVFAGCNDYNFTAPAHTFDITPQFKGIGLGETVQLAAIGADGAPVAVTWSSDSTAIVTVSPTGLVTGVGAGGPIGVIAKLSSDPAQTQVSSITVLKGFVRAISGALNEEAIYTIKVPAGSTKLTVTIAGGTGDVDMYVRYNAEPTGGASDNCKSEKAGNAESCVITNPQAGTWYILTYAFEAFSGATLTALFE